MNVPFCEIDNEVFVKFMERPWLVHMIADVRDKTKVGTCRTSSIMKIV